MLKNIKISTQIVTLALLGIIFLSSLSIVTYFGLNNIAEKTEYIKKNTQIIKNQTIILNSIAKKIKLNISLTKMEAFESIVAKKLVADNEFYIKAFTTTDNEIKALKQFLVKYKKNKSLHEMHTNIKKDFYTYRLILETLQEEIEEDEEYGRGILEDEVKPIEKKLFSVIDNLVQKTDKKFNTKFNEISEDIDKANEIVSSTLSINITISKVLPLWRWRLENLQNALKLQLRRLAKKPRIR